jgi:hypothetical protein|tara:strand:- start:435 stop:773 length:339 start_codon:yes stop_codon:yes gene_type:complete
MPSQAMRRPALQRNKPMDSAAKFLASAKKKSKDKVGYPTKKKSGVKDKVGYPVKKKKQGYNAKLDESLGMRKGKESGKKQSMKSRRDESKGMAKKVGKKRAYGAVKSMDKKK